MSVRHSATTGGVVTRMRRWLAIPAVVPLIVLGSLPGSADASADGDSSIVPPGTNVAAFTALPDSADIAAPILLEGVLVGPGGKPTEGTVVAYAWPNEDTERLLKVGDTVPTVMVAKAFADKSGQFELRLDSSSVPKSNLSRFGVVNLELLAWTESSVGRFSVPVEATLTDGLEVWTDPMIVTEVAAGLVKSSDIPVSVEVSLTEPMKSSAARGEGAGIDSFLCDWTLKSTYVTWETVAITSPAAGQTGTATFSSSNTHTLGVAVSANGATWSASGTSSISAGFTHEWPYSSIPENYLARVQMAKYQETPAYLCGDWKTKAQSHTGGTSIEGRGDLGYTSHCEPVYAGNWIRNWSNGNAFSLSGGLETSGILGINLSAKHQYSTSVSITYHQDGPRQVCGNNAAPSLASIVDGHT